MSKLYFKAEQAFIESEHPILDLVEIKELKGNHQEEPKTGMLRVWMHQSPNGLKLQLRAKTALTDRSQPKNLIATTHVSVEQLREIVNFFEGLRSQPRYMLFLRPAEEYHTDRPMQGRAFRSNDLAILVRMMHKAMSRVRQNPWMLAWLTEERPDKEFRQLAVMIDERKLGAAKNRALQPICRNCHHWRDKAWSGDQGVGVCDNPNVDVRPRCKAILASQGVEEWAADEILQSVRFPSDFGCRFFEPIPPSHEDITKA